MHKRNRILIALALAYALISGLIGLSWLMAPGALPGNIPRVHGHMMLLGFVAMLIYGVAYHVIPRFSGRPLFSERMANWQAVIANVGLLVMVAGWILLMQPVVTVGGAITWLALAMFSINLMLTVRHYGPRG